MMLIRLRTLFVLATVTVTLGLSACGGSNENENSGSDTTAVSADSAGTLTDQTIVDVLRSDNQFSTFVAALDSAGLTSVFEDEGPFTVFVPTNETFGGSPLLAPDSRDRLRDVLLYHAVQESVAPEDLRSRDRLTTLQGDDLAVAPADTLQAAGPYTVGGAAVTDPNVSARNGKIYVINSVLMPPTPAEP